MGERRPRECIAGGGLLVSGGAGVLVGKRLFGSGGVSPLPLRVMGDQRVLGSRAGEADFNRAERPNVGGEAVASFSLLSSCG